MAPRRMFFAFASHCFDSSIDDSMTDAEIIDFALETAREIYEDYPGLKAYLDELLSGQYSDADLDKLWMSTSANIMRIGGGGTRQLLELARERLRLKLNV